MRAFGFVVVALTLVVPVGVHAQNTRLLTGNVASGFVDVPFAGAEIRIVDSDVRVCATALGDFTMPVPVTGETRLRITPVGFGPQEVVVMPGERTVEVALGNHLFILDEVRVVGYAAEFGDLRETGASIARLESEDINIVPAMTIEGAMQGKIAGAFIQANSGAPGGGFQITLRGVNTILGSPDPLIIVDGVTISTGAAPTGLNLVTREISETVTSRLADINPGDVERIEVLRGPAAASMYGSRASNGVVLVTTKRGRKQAPEEIERAQVLQCFLPGSALTQIR